MTQLEAATGASAEGARADRGRLVQLVVAAVLMGATGVMLVATGISQRSEQEGEQLLRHRRPGSARVCC
jgi:hypothetical protein